MTCIRRPAVARGRPVGDAGGLDGRGDRVARPRRSPGARRRPAGRPRRGSGRRPRPARRAAGSIRARIVSGWSSERWYSAEPSMSHTPAHARRAEDLVVRVARRAADPAAGHPADELVRRDVDQHGDPDARVARSARASSSAPRLHVGPREAVEDHAAVGVGPAEPVEQQADGDLVGHELARVHVAPGLDAERRPVADGGPEQVAGGHDRDPQPLGEERRLRPLPGAGRAEEDDDLHLSAGAPPWRGGPKAPASTRASARRRA